MESYQPYNKMQLFLYSSCNFYACSVGTNNSILSWREFLIFYTSISYGYWPCLWPRPGYFVTTL